MCAEEGVVPQSLVTEVVDRTLAKQIRKSHPSVGYISSSELMALFTSQVVEHEELNRIWHELLESYGSEIYIKDARLYCVPGVGVSFEALAEAAAARGEVAIGWRIDGRTRLNPEKQRALVFKPGDGVVAIAPDNK